MLTEIRELIDIGPGELLTALLFCLVVVGISYFLFLLSLAEIAAKPADDMSSEEFPPVAVPAPTNARS